MDSDNTNWVIIGAIASVICAVIATLSFFNVKPDSTDSSEAKEVVQKASSQDNARRTDSVNRVDSNSGAAKAVDLGLSVKWADRNVGASYPQDCGDYYAWGEIETKRKYSIIGYRWYWPGRLKMLKYKTNSKGGKKDGKSTLDVEDDVASVKWGHGWRVPTEEEFKELIRSCRWTYSVMNGINGLVLTGNNGNSIFLPAAGYCEKREVKDYGAKGYYLTSDLRSSSDFWAAVVEFNSSRTVSYSTDPCYWGFSVRPVCE